MYNGKIPVQLFSEVGELEAVILHAPNNEVENMTPETAKRALYSDILNLAVARSEYQQLSGVLNLFTKTFQVRELLSDVLTIDKVKNVLVEKICKNENVTEIQDFLLSLSNEELSHQLIEGVLLKKDNLTKFLDKERYALQPIPNFFFTRDASVAMFNNILISSMANKVRQRESIIMETIFNYHPNFLAKTFNPENSVMFSPLCTMEGGDILVPREDVLLVGVSCRTSSYGIDFLIEHLKKEGGKFHLIAQELPYSPESFIHLDMVFTFLDSETCMIFAPLILTPARYLTIRIDIENGEVTSISQEKNLLSCLNNLNFDLKPLFCGGRDDIFVQEREQWHSGANFFCLAPSKIIGYGRNTHTIEELNKNGFEVMRANDVISKQIDIFQYKKCVVTIEGSELSRGGGGCRCMTMPVRRKLL